MVFKKITQNAFTYLIPIVMIDYYLIMRGVNLNMYVVLPLFAILGLKTISIAVKSSKGIFIKAINIFLGYSLLSIIFYAFNDTPISCYFTTLRSFVFPIIFAYLGYQYSVDHSFNEWYLVGCAFCFVIGFYLYLAGPDYYIEYLDDIRNNLWYKNDESINETNILFFSRFSSFFPTSYAISSFSIPALILSLSYSFNNKNIGINKLWLYVIAISSFIAAIICQQRIAMAFALFIVIFYGFTSGKLSNSRGRLGLIFAYIIIGIIVVFSMDSLIHQEWFDRVKFLVSNHIEAMDFSKAMDSRTNQYFSFDRATGLSYIFGLGLGSCGHAAMEAGLQGIADGEFVKLFYEFGFWGCSILAGLILSTLYRGLKYFKLYHAEVLIIIFYLAAGVGSDALTFFIYSIMFWYSMGRIWNKDYYQRMVDAKLQKYE